MSTNFTQVTHPILQYKLSVLRKKDTNPISFRALMNELSKFLAYEYAKDMETETYPVETPFAMTEGIRPKHYPIVVSILRAGNGMIDGVLETLPHSPAGHIGIYRDKFINNTVEYYFKLPEKTKGKEVLIIDPMLATGDTAIAAIDRLKQYDVGKISMMSLLASPEGIEKLHHFHPDVHIYCISKEDGLDENGYLLPGMGDAGDRLYNTGK